MGPPVESQYLIDAEVYPESLRSGRHAAVRLCRTNETIATLIKNDPLCQSPTPRALAESLIARLCDVNSKVAFVA